MNVCLGAKLGQGAEVLVYEHKTDPGLVVKIPRDRPDLETVLAERLAGERCLHQAGLSGHVLETLTAVPGFANGRRYAFVETQTRIQTTLFDDVGDLLRAGQIDLSLKAVQRFFDFERSVLWASGVVMRDCGSFLKNVAVHEGKLKLLDFSSMSCAPLALERMILSGKAGRRIQCALKKFKSLVDAHKVGALWSEFHGGLWRIAENHYRLDFEPWTEWAFPLGEGKFVTREGSWH